MDHINITKWQNLQSLFCPIALIVIVYVWLTYVTTVYVISKDLYISKIRGTFK